MLTGIVVSGGCLKAKAKTPGPIAVLTVPEPPTRLLVPVAIEPPPTPTPVPTDRSTTTPATPTRPTSTGRGTPPPVATPTPTPVENPPPVLQTSGTLQELEARARERVDNADKILSRISKATLGRDARDQYESASLYVRKAKDAITTKNYPYAISCADKAATLASLIVKSPS